jgi:2-C-methyl-D-erythritol 4-phosphate cytidylyltransferase
MPAHTSALIPAAGLGLRLGLGPKCLLRLGKQTVLELVVTTLSSVVDEVLVAAPEGFEAELRSMLGGRAEVITGGSTRQDSIDALLHASTGQLLLIQDAARPFASRALHTAVLDAAFMHGAAGAFLDPTVPVGLLVDGTVASYRTRQEARIFQAPQAYSREVLTDARRKSAGRQFQSTAQMVIDAGHALWAVPGEPENIKITTPLDWLIAQRVIAPSLGLDT